MNAIGLLVLLFLGASGHKSIIIKSQIYVFSCLKLNYNLSVGLWGLMGGVAQGPLRFSWAKY